MEVLNPEHPIATLSRGGKLHMELLVQMGRGYVPAERNKTATMSIGTIPIDALFSPVRKVNYTVTNARVGQQTDYDKLTLEVWTDGSVTPEDAVAYAAKILKDQLSIFINFEETEEPVEETVSEEAAKLNENLDKSRRRARAVGALGQLPAERQHPLHRRARAEDRSRDAEDEELRPQVAQGDQRNPRRDGPLARHEARRLGAADDARQGVSRRPAENGTMRHQKSGRKFSRKSGPRHALLSNLVTSLIEHERIKTTDAKAKELRKVAERTISWATSVGSLVGNDKADAADKARIVHAMRMAQRVVKHKPTLHKLFEEIGPRLVGRAGRLPAHHEARLSPRRCGAGVDRRVRRSRRAGGRGGGGAGRRREAGQGQEGEGREAGGRAGAKKAAKKKAAARSRQKAEEKPAKKKAKKKDE